MEDSETGCPSSISVRMEYLLLNSDIVNLVWKTRGGYRKHCFVNFCFLIFVLLDCDAQTITFLCRRLV